MERDDMDAHGLEEWTLRFGAARRRLGACFVQPKIIEIARWHAAHGESRDVTNTILHEIAHALAGAKAGRRLVHRTRGAGAARARRDRRRVRRRHGEGPRARDGSALRGEHRRRAPGHRVGEDGAKRAGETRATAHAPAKGTASGAGQGAHRSAARAPARGPGRWPHRRAQPRAPRGRLRHAAAPGRAGGAASDRYR